MISYSRENFKQTSSHERIDILERSQKKVTENNYVPRKYNE